MPVISIPTKKAEGTLSRSAKSFTPGGTGGFALRGITLNWQPNQSSGPVSFSFTLTESDGAFPVGLYSFSGNIAGPGSPCPPDTIACGMVKWPGPEHDEVPWQATGGVGEPGKDKENPSAHGEKPSYK